MSIAIETQAPPSSDRLARGVATAQRRVVLATIGLVALVIFPGLTDPVMLPKATVLAAGAAAVVLLALAGCVASGTAVRPVSGALGALGLLVVMMAVVTVLSEDSATSALGRLGRYGGLVQYASYAVLMTAIAVAYRARSLRGLTVTLLLTMSVVVGYGVVQLLGYDLIVWNSGRDDPWFATMGNTNFASAYVGVLVPVALSVSLRSHVRTAWRVLAALLAAVGYVYTVFLAALQGPIVGVIGAAVVVAVAVTDKRALLRRVIGSVRLRVLSAVVVLAGLPVVWRMLTFFVQDLPPSLYGRTLLWRAAGSMFLDNPVAGTGLDGYGDHFFASRPLVHAAKRGTSVADAAHQVPLSMFAGGGLLVGLAYVALVVVVGVVAVRGLRRLEGDSRIVLAGYAGAWLAYQVQSLVSIDVPPVAMLHFVTAGAVVALAQPPAIVEMGRAAVPRLTRVVALGLIALLALPVLAGVIRPLRADVAAAFARDAARAGERERALEFALRAVDRMPYEPSYRRALGKRLAREDGERALRELARAAELEAGSVSYLQDVVVQARRLGDRDTVRYWQSELVRRDPWNADGLVQQAELALEEERFDDAQELYGRLIQLKPSRLNGYYGLAAAQAGDGDLAGARRTYEQLLEIKPGEERASRKLAELGRDS